MFQWLVLVSIALTLVESKYLLVETEDSSEALNLQDPLQGVGEVQEDYQQAIRDYRQNNRGKRKCKRNRRGKCKKKRKKNKVTTAAPSGPQPRHLW